MKIFRRLVWGISIALLLASYAHAECDPNSMLTAAANGAAGAAVSAGPPANTSKTWHLSSFFVICGKSSAAVSETNITVSGLSGAPSFTYPIDESTTGVSWVEDASFRGAPASAANTALTVSMPSLSNGGACTVKLEYCP